MHFLLKYANKRHISSIGQTPDPSAALSFEVSVTPSYYGCVFSAGVISNHFLTNKKRLTYEASLYLSNMFKSAFQSNAL